jgi:two-component system cell cycle sensor histidine kinase/response regulator CckA
MDKIRPGVKVLYTSGYTPDVVHNKGILVEGINFIAKPSTPQELLGKIRAILDSP